LLTDLRFEDLRFDAGGPIFGLVGVAIDEVDGTTLEVFGVVVVLGCGFGFALGFTMEADLELMNPASVGWCTADDWGSLEAFLRGIAFVKDGIPRMRLDIQDERCEVTNGSPQVAIRIPNMSASRSRGD
jgi:hypothetical protein